ncbi:hypothetical protein CCP3SC1AL1_1620015 [Gammaproteobacteria bacterium]
MKLLSGFTHVTECDDDDHNIVCPCCLSDHLSESDIKPDGLCEACTECTECEKCGKWILPQDMANEEFCCDCVEEIEREKKSNERFENSHGYGSM